MRIPFWGSRTPRETSDGRRFLAIPLGGGEARHLHVGADSLAKAALEGSGQKKTAREVANMRADQWIPDETKHRWAKWLPFTWRRALLGDFLDELERFDVVNRKPEEPSPWCACKDPLRQVSKLEELESFPGWAKTHTVAGLCHACWKPIDFEAFESYEGEREVEEQARTPLTKESGHIGPAIDYLQHQVHDVAEKGDPREARRLRSLVATLEAIQAGRIGPNPVAEALGHLTAEDWEGPPPFCVCHDDPDRLTVDVVRSVDVAPTMDPRGAMRISGFCCRCLKPIDADKRREALKEARRPVLDTSATGFMDTRERKGE